MSNLVEKQGSLFDSTADAYAHGVNTRGVIGAGIAKIFKLNYRQMYAAYSDLCKAGQLEAGEVWVWDRTIDPIVVFNPRWIYNIASQDKPGADARLEWFERGLIRTLKHALDNEVETIAMPRIGCGIGGLEWEDVREIIKRYAELTPVDIEVWSL